MKNKRAARSHKSYYKQRANKYWFFNHTGHRAWMLYQRKQMSATPAPTEAPIEHVEAEEVAD